MTVRLAAWLSALVLGAALLAELLLRPPNGAERWHLIVILAAPALVAAALVPLLQRWVSSRASVAGAALVVGLCSLALGAVTTSAASNAMFLSAHDYRLFLVVLVLSSGIALVVGTQLTRPLARDIARLGHVAERVAQGDLTARTGIERTDEVGRTAIAVDEMVASLQAAADEQVHLAAARQLLFTSIGHDLRTPLAAIRAAVESVQDGVADEPDRYMRVIGSELDNVEALLDQLVEFARIEAGRRSTTESVALAEVAHEAVEALAPLAAQRRVEIRLLSDGPAFVMASPLDLGRILRNPLENAIRHAPNPGHVDVEVTDRPDGIFVAIRDDGDGFPIEFRPHAFEPFTRADTARTGRSGHSGLGLAITKALVEQCGGRVWLGDGPGGHVNLWFPHKEHS
jgi:two-component system sensor histidine kinase BaeS